MFIDAIYARDLYRRAIDAGATRRGLTSATWNIAGDCENPRVMSLEGRPAPTVKRWGQAEVPVQSKFTDIPRSGVPYFVEMFVRCRECPTCLQRRCNMWMARARHEVQWTPGRTWFVTLTVNPFHRAQAVAKANVMARKAGIPDLEREAIGVQFRYLNKAMSEWTTLFLKRLRREYETDKSDKRFRYLLVAEPHKNGFPHFHLLVHEYEGTVLQKTFGRWGHGFWSAKLVSNGSQAARYVSKYIAKGLKARVRASQFYGSPEKSPIGIASAVQRELLTPKLGKGIDYDTVFKRLAKPGRTEHFGKRSGATSTHRPVGEILQGPHKETQNSLDAEQGGKYSPSFEWCTYTVTCIEVAKGDKVAPPWSIPWEDW